MFIIKIIIQNLSTIIPYILNFFNSISQKEILIKRNGKIVKKIYKSKIIKPKTLYEKVKYYYSQNGIEFQKINIFGVSNTDNPYQDKWNDIIGIAFNGKIILFRSTTDPSVYWTNNRNRKKANMPDGAAHLCYGYHKNIWISGKHRGKYPALIQRSGKVKVWRDLNENFKNDDNLLISGWLGINLHHGYNAKRIGVHSAGCQVVQKVKDLQKIMNIVKESEQEKFSYFLFKKSEVDRKLRII